MNILFYPPKSHNSSNPHFLVKIILRDWFKFN
jgi:hypothetical protein